MRLGVVHGVLLVAALLSASGCGTLSVAEERDLGHQVQRQIRQDVQLMRDRVVVNYVRKLGARLAAAAGPSAFDRRFYVVEDEAPNAFAIPGGAIYLHTGTLLLAEDLSGVAGVLAHEIGHVTARHFANRYKRQRNTSYLGNAFAFVVYILTGNPYLGNAGSLASEDVLGSGAAASAARISSTWTIVSRPFEIATDSKGRLSPSSAWTVRTARHCVASM